VLALLAVAAVLGAGPSDGPAPVELRAAIADDAPTWAVVDDLADGDVLRVRVIDGEPGRGGTVAQCSTSCWNRFPVTFDADGVARFQYELDRRSCDPQASCVVRVEVGARTAVAFTVFGGPAPPAPTAVIVPDGPVAPGAQVTVQVDGLAPGADVQLSFCAEACGGRRVAAADETGRATLTVPVGARCDGCGIAVVAGSSRAMLPVRFVAAPAPRYDPMRLLAFLALAGALLAVAWRLVVTTDWRPPSEAAVPDAPD
jgi:hypothetical protein